MTGKWSAIGDILRRYGQVFRAAWAERRALEPIQRTREELAFLPAHLELAETPLSPAPRVSLWIIMSLFCIALLWAGFGKLDAAQEAYFRRNLEAVTKGDKARGLLFYCMSDCWHSWNAAHRAIEWGYSHVAWYPLGTDGWREHGGAFVEVTPVNFLGSGS